jgi:hypothetical protein
MAVGEAQHQYVVRVAKVQLTPKADDFPRIGDGKHAMTYMISGGKTFNMVLAHRQRWAQSSQVKDLVFYD